MLYEERELLRSILVKQIEIVKKKRFRELFFSKRIFAA